MSDAVGITSRITPHHHAMNMRAAEAIVSNAPKPMKIFPIREVWSQVELSWLVSITGAAGGFAEAAEVEAGVALRKLDKLARQRRVRMQPCYLVTLLAGGAANMSGLGSQVTR